MQSTDWTTEQCELLRGLRAKGSTFAEIAAAINARFGTGYSRNAAIGRARRMGIGGPVRLRDFPDRWPKLPPTTAGAGLHSEGERQGCGATWLPPACRRATPHQLRCIALEPRHVALVALEPGDCRYPYGGDEEGEAITFCGHPRRAGSSYCVPHFHLTRGVGTVSERAAVSVGLRLVDAA